MLGWSVPKECPIQNYVDNNRKFHQRVDRIDLGTLNWVYYSSQPYGYPFFRSSIESMKDETKNLYLVNYVVDISDSGWITLNKAIKASNPFSYNEINITDSDYTDAATFKVAMQGVYLYYELVDEVLIPMDGGEISNTITDLKMLGWSVPSECPIKNYMDSNRVFHQRVGRIDLGTLNWEYASSPAAGSAFFFCQYLNIKRKNQVYCYKYNYDINGISLWQEGKDKVINTKEPYTAYEINIVDSSYTDASIFKQSLQGIYLYYELANEITIPVDGNEATDNHIISDAYDSDKTYYVGDYCIYSNQLWKCLVQNSGQTPSEGTYWHQTSMSNELHKNSFGIPVRVTASSMIVPNDGIIRVSIAPFTEDHYGSCVINGISFCQFMSNNSSIYAVMSTPIKAGQTVRSEYSDEQKIEVNYYPYV